MKKFTLALMAVLAFSFSLKAQQFVSTNPTNRNVIIEEFTGRNCGYCPDGHVYANGIVHNNPGRAWAINIHAGSFSPTSYPNFQCPDGIAIHNGFSISGYPAGTVNRCGGNQSYGRNQWSGLANQQLSQVSEVNIGGRVVINPAARVATITVEVYYTANAEDPTNYLTVAMLQDSIWGSQSGGSSNPEQWVNGQYCHMHILRDVVNSSDAWGDALTQTTAGTLITKEYTYEIPEVIGSPNGVDVDIDNLHFLAWVAKNHYYVLSANELDVVQGSDEPIFPFFKGFAQQESVSCSNAKVLLADVMNGGTETITSMTFETQIGNDKFVTEWNGSVAQFDRVVVEIPVEVPFGTHTASVHIISVNGQDYDGSSTTASVNCVEWSTVEVSGDSEELTLKLMQDKFGNQITWKFFASDMSVIAEGGPYSMLMGETATQMHIEHVTVPANECIMFAIYDNVGNGICCAYGDGYYQIYDSNNNLVIDGSGDFGTGASHVISIGGEVNVELGGTEVQHVSDTEANFISTLNYQGYPDEVGFEYRMVTNSTVNTVVGIINEFKKIMATVNDLEPNTIYVVKSYAIIGGVTYYGAETTFNSSDGVEEWVNSLRLYPNPTSGVLNVEAEGMTRVEVYNAMGQLVLSKESDGDAMQISTSGLNSGMYFARIFAQNGEMVNKAFSVAR